MIKTDLEQSGGCVSAVGTSEAARGGLLSVYPDAGVSFKGAV